MQDILEKIPAQLHQLLNYTGCVALTLDGGNLRAAAARGFVPNVDPLRRELSDLEQDCLSALMGKAVPTRIVDLTLESDLCGCGIFEGMRACIAVPILFGTRALGILLILHADAHYYTEQHAFAALVFANQVGIAIENARLAAESSHRALQIETASQVGQKVITILQREEMLAEVVRLIQEKLGYYQVNLLLVDKASNELYMRESSGANAETFKARNVRLKIGAQGITGWVAHTGQPFLCNDTRREPRYFHDPSAAETRSELCVPLRNGEVILGVLDVQSSEENAFHADDLMALQVLGDQLAVALENARLIAQTRRQIDVMRAMHDISLDITSRLDSEQVLRGILEQATSLLHAKASTLAIFDPNQGLVRIIMRNFPARYTAEPMRPGEGVAGRVVATGKPLIVNDYEHWEGRRALPTRVPFNAFLSVPLHWQGQVFGALNALDRTEERQFTSNDVKLLSLFADLASIAYKKAELYTEVVELSHQLEHKVLQRTHELALTREELAQKADQLQQLLSHTVHIQEIERARIAQDLHDGASQLITGTLFELQAAHETISSGRSDMAFQKLETAKDLLRRIEAENRRIIYGLRPPMLDAQGLLAALKWHASTFENHFGISSSVHMLGEPVRMLPDAEISIYRIAQEAFNNIAAHAKARRVTVRVEFLSGCFRLSIEDDGVGINGDMASRSSPLSRGLIGMRERAQSLGGDIQIESSPGQGTRVLFNVPLSDLILAKTSAQAVLDV